MVKNTKTWIFWKRSITFLRYKKILNLCLRWLISRCYHFLAEVTFKCFICRGSSAEQSTFSVLLKIFACFCKFFGFTPKWIPAIRNKSCGPTRLQYVYFRVKEVQVEASISLLIWKCCRGCATVPSFLLHLKLLGDES